MHPTPDLHVYNVYTLEVDIEKLTQLITALTLAKGRALPGQEQFVMLTKGLPADLAIRVLPPEQRVNGIQKFAGLPAPSV